MAQKSFLSLPIGGIAVLTVEVFLIIMLNIFLFGDYERNHFDQNLSYLSSEEKFGNIEGIVT